MDYKPLNMTILYAEDLEILGINTLSEALDFASGIQTFETTYFSSVVSVRGHTQPFNTFQNKIEFKIDGMSVPSNYFENFPISLTERIEISKGSDSIIYGKSGYIAVINIITKNKKKKEMNITICTLFTLFLLLIFTRPLLIVYYYNITIIIQHFIYLYNIVLVILFACYSVVNIINIY